jgi:hypothetical protein
MNDLIFSRLTLIWLLLIGATLLSVEFVGGLFPVGGVRAAAVAVMIVAFIKVRFVGLDFIELRSAPKIARVAFDVWLVCVCSSMIAVYLSGISV